MHIREMMEKKQILSFEIFPPKRTDHIATIYKAVEDLKDLQPDFISVTYGAGGSGANKDTLNIASAIKNTYHLESVAHLPCINLTKSDVLAMLSEFKDHHIENILALRGDIHPEIIPKQDFRYAADLIAFIKEQGDFHISAACYPEVHHESKGVVDDIHHLKEKVDAGAEHLITQLFFDNAHFYRFRERTQIVGMDVPIEAGIMPVVNKKQIERMVTLCKVELPRKFLSMMEKFEHSPEAIRDAGIAYAIDQIVDLIAEGVDGIHLYTMNNPYIARRIYEAVHTLLYRAKN